MVILAKEVAWTCWLGYQVSEARRSAPKFSHLPVDRAWFLTGCWNEGITGFLCVQNTWQLSFLRAKREIQVTKEEKRTQKRKCGVFYNLILEFACYSSTACYWSQRPIPIQSRILHKSMNTSKWGSLWVILEAGSYALLDLLSSFCKEWSIKRRSS